MEVTARTASDRKGGHLALRDGHLILRESAQCPDADLDAFQDIERHRYFNTNNLWLHLERLREALDGNYKLVDQLDAAIPDGPPSLVECDRLTVIGPVRFAPGVTIAGRVTITNPSSDRLTIAPGRYQDTAL